MMHEVIQAPAAVVFGILELRADLAECLVFPAHLARCEVPLGVARHAGRFEIGALVADRATHRRKPETVRATLDRRLMQAAGIALARAVAGGGWQLTQRGCCSTLPSSVNSAAERCPRSGIEERLSGSANPLDAVCGAARAAHRTTTAPIRIAPATGKRTLIRENGGISPAR